jgi:hypothetical protein
MYYICMVIFYAGKIEILRIDKKKGIMVHKLYNIFLSKVEKSYNLDDIVDIEVLYKGVIRHNSDSTRYYIRFTFKDTTKLVFGECMTFRKASEKYRRCFAIIKGIVIKDIDRSVLTDETIDEEALLNE